jgi:hypothetical protein
VARPWVGVPTISRFHGIAIRMYWKWAAVHQPELEENWLRARNRATLMPIEPWK